MDLKTIKPRMVFFQWDHNNLPGFLKIHMQLHVKCLFEFFDVILINKDCDYQQVCDIYQPDLTLFESGFKSTISKKLTIKNTSTYPEIPKLGLHNGDGWCESRVSFFSDMNRWGVDTFFSISTTTAEHTPEITNNLYVWPNFIDGDLYKDYGQDKTVNVLFTGSMISLYPWRQKIFEIISKTYTSLTIPHLGYEKNSSIMIHGEQYARTINSSWFVPACGSIAQEVVRKHFEVPGSKSCLITEKTPALEAAGFVDMKNCVFGNENEIMEKLDFLFKNKHLLSKIIDAGYELVHTQHTLKQRDQIRQWFDLFKNLKSHEKIIQLNPFTPLIIVNKFSNQVNKPIINNGLHLQLLRKGDEMLWEGKYEEAEVKYLECLKYIAWMSEPKLKLAICALFKGDPTKSLEWIILPIQNQMAIYKGSEPDPVEWAYYIISLLCQGKLNEATIRANQFKSFIHPELERTRWVINCLQNEADVLPRENNHLLKHHYSIHQLPQLSFNDWINNICIILKACQKVSYAEILKNNVYQKEELIKLKRVDKVKIIFRRYLLIQRIKAIEKINNLFNILHIPNYGTGMPSIYLINFTIRLVKWAKFDIAYNWLKN